MQKYKQGLELWGLSLRSNGGGTVTGSNFLGTLIHANTVDRTYTLPDKSGTIALLSDISTGGLSLSSTLVGYALGTDGTALAETDTILQAYQKLQVQSNNKANLAGDTFTGSVGISDTTASTSSTTGALVVSGGVGIGGDIYAAGNINAINYIINNVVSDRYLFYKTSNYNRWSIGVDSYAESGSNAGSNLRINTYSDNGAWLATPLTINRATNIISLAGQLSLTASTGIYIPDGAPSITTNKIYSVGGSLYFNGSAVGGTVSSIDCGGAS